MANNIQHLKAKIMALSKTHDKTSALKALLSEGYPQNLIEKHIKNVNFIQDTNNTSKLNSTIQSPEQKQQEEEQQQQIEELPQQQQQEEEQQQQETERQKQETELLLYLETFVQFNTDTKNANNKYNQHKEVLQANLVNPCSNSSYCINDWEIDKAYSSENLDKYQNSNFRYFITKSLPTEQIKQIPHTLHYVWFSSSEYTTDKRQKKFTQNNAYLEETLQKLQSLNQGWQVKLWTNDTNFISEEDTTRLRKLGVPVLDINKLDFTDHEKYQKLLNASLMFATNKEFGLATDLARYLILHKEGGLYIDGDYHIKKAQELNKAIDLSTSIVGIERSSDYRLGNGFLASTKAHPLMSEMLDLVYRNIFDQNSAHDYIKYPCTPVMRTINISGPVALTIAYAHYDKNEKIKSTDIVFPYRFLNTSQEDMNSNDECFNEYHDICEYINTAHQEFTKSWMGSNSETKFSELC